MSERLKIIDIDVSPKQRRHTRNFVWPRRTPAISQQERVPEDTLLMEKTNLPLSKEMPASEIPSKQDIFVSSTMVHSNVSYAKTSGK